MHLIILAALMLCSVSAFGDVPDADEWQSQLTPYL